MQIVPDLAVSVPTPTDGGTTYRFQLRRGIRYSNGAVVSPADVRFRSSATSRCTRRRRFSQIVAPPRA